MTLASVSPAASARLLLWQQARDRLEAAGFLATAEQIAARLTAVAPAVSDAQVTFEAASAVGRSDSRFSFVLRLEGSAAVGAAIGAGVTGRSNGGCITVPARANALVTLLDGLLDDASGLDDPAVRAVRTVLLELATSGDELVCRAETVVGQIAVNMALQLRRDLQASPGFAQPDVRDMMQEEVSLALSAEFATTLRSRDREIWRAKSAHTAAACALASLMMLPEVSARGVQRVRDIMREAGALVGWLDDIADFEHDLQTGNGSEVVCMLEEMLPIGVPALVVASSVGTTVIRRAIDRETQSRIAAVLEQLAGLPSTHGSPTRSLLRDACTMAGGFASGNQQSTGS